MKRTKQKTTFDFQTKEAAKLRNEAGPKNCATFPKLIVSDTPIKNCNIERNLDLKSKVSSRRRSP